MGDSFIEAMNSGWEHGAKLMQDAADFQVKQEALRQAAALHQMQMAKMANELSISARNQNAMQQLLTPTQQTYQERIPNSSPPSDDVEPVDEYQQVSRTIENPGLTLLKRSYPQAEQFLKMGISPEHWKEPVRKTLENLEAEKAEEQGLDLDQIQELRNKKDALGYHIEKESVGGDLTQDYRVFVDKQGNVAKREKVGVPYKNQAGIAVVRAEGFGKIRPVQVLDTKNNNRPITISMDELSRAMQEEPDRYVSASGGEKALNKTALIEDIRGNINLTRKSLANLKTDFTPSQRAALAYVLKSSDPKSSISSFMQGTIASQLSPDQMDYVTDIFQLHENAMAMRSVLGAGQGSDELRAAIRATVPGGNTPSKEWGHMQLNKFENVINRLSRGVPKVDLRNDIKPETGTPANPKIPPNSDMNVGGFNIKNIPKNANVAKVAQEIIKQKGKKTPARVGVDRDTGVTVIKWNDGSTTDVQ